MTLLSLHKSQLPDIPAYVAIDQEVEVFQMAWKSRLPILLKGPTGCGKTRFVEHMAARLQRPLFTVSCHDDLSAADLVGRHLIGADGTYWVDGPLTQAVRQGGICYLDEIVEARKDTTVVLHPLTDARRILPLSACNELLQAHPDFQLVVSYNPGYQALHKTLKPSTRQRFVGLEFNYPAAEQEAAVVAHEGQVDIALARQLVAVAERTRRLKEHGLTEGASTRMLIHAASLSRQGLSARVACQQAITCPLCDDPDLATALAAAVDASFAH